MLIVLKKCRVKQTLVMALMFILAGSALVLPVHARAAEFSAAPDLLYLAPAVDNAPVDNNGQFFAMDFPQYGTGTLNQFLDRFPYAEMVIDVPADNVLYAGFLSGISRTFIYYQKQKAIEQKRIEQAKENIEYAKNKGKKPFARDLAILERERQRQLQKNKPVTGRDLFGNTIYDLVDYYKYQFDKKKSKQIQDKLEPIPSEQIKEKAKKAANKKITQVDRSALELPYIQKMAVYREILRNSTPGKEYEQSAIMIQDHIREYGINKYGELLNPAFHELMKELMEKTSKDTIEIPNNSETDTVTILMIGNTFLLGGAALLVKVLLMAAL